MMHLISRVLVFAVSLAIGASANPHRQSRVNDPGCKTGYSVDHMKLALQWQPGYCATTKKRCASYRPVFSIHGLWPNNASGDQHVEYCCVRDKYDSNQLNHLVGLLKQDWPSLTDSSLANSRGFWDYQYKKHGSCADRIKGLSGAYNYFSFALKLFNKIINPKEALERANIVPSDSAVYSGQRIANVLSGALGNKVALDCQVSDKSPVAILKQVYVCVDVDLERIGCPYTKKACLGDIKYPLTARQ